MSPSWSKNILLPIALACISWGANGADEPRYSLKVGESADLGGFYWANRHCESLLIGFKDLDLLEGPPGIELSIRKEDVKDERPGCQGRMIPGGVVVLTAKAIPSKFIGIIRFRVRYKTMTEGITESTHSRNIALYPN
jgi:hypothetical protein